MAFNSAEVAIRLAKGKDPVREAKITVDNGHHLIPSILVEGQIVHKQNTKLTVVSDGFATEKEILSNTYLFESSC